MSPLASLGESGVIFNFSMKISLGRKIRAVAGQRNSCALPLNLLKSMTHDLELKVTQVGRDGTA